MILHLHRKLPIADFFKIINEKPLACSLLEVYCKQQNLPLLKDFYYQADNKSDMAAILTNESYEEKVSIQYIYINFYYFVFIYM